MINAIILAAGKGTRMKSEQAKCMQLVMGKPILRYIVDNLKAVGCERIIMIIGYQGESIQEYFKDEVEYAWQAQQLGTGHAVKQASTLNHLHGKTIVINGDVPLVKPSTLLELLEEAKNTDLVLLSTIMDDPQKYGRIVRNNAGKFLRIVETKDCSPLELKISEINAAIYCFDNFKLFNCLPFLQNNNQQGEFYITDMVELFRERSYSVSAKIIEDQVEMMGVDHRMGQELAIKNLQQTINNRHLENGVYLEDISNIYIEDTVLIENDVQIQANVRLQGTTVIKKGSTITSGSVLINAVINENCTIENSKIINSEVGAFTTIGPMAHIREYSVIGVGCRIGNFVEFKKALFGNGSKCAHLTYMGDCEVGEKVNIGCGVVCVNYDGKNKSKTIIGDGAFIGSNCNLIAPITIGKNALVAAGSTVNQDVADGDMGIARPLQVNKVGYGLKYKNK